MAEKKESKGMRIAKVVYLGITIPLVLFLIGMYEDAGSTLGILLIYGTLTMLIMSAVDYIMSGKFDTNYPMVGFATLYIILMGTDKYSNDNIVSGIACLYIIALIVHLVSSWKTMTTKSKTLIAILILFLATLVGMVLK